MAISQELQDRYASEVDIDWHNAFVLKHPMAETHYFVDHVDLMPGYFEGRLCTFLPLPTHIEPPRSDDSGRVELTLVWGNIKRYAQHFLQFAAQDATQPIQCYHSVLIEGDQSPQIDPWIEYHLTDVVVTVEGVSATATRTDIINHPFPKALYRVSTYPGLRRR